MLNIQGRFHPNSFCCRLLSGKNVQIVIVFQKSFLFQSAPIFGYLGDRFSRKLLMGIGVFIWGGFSLAASFMPSYWYFLVTRALIAIGKYDIFILYILKHILTGESAFTTIAPAVLGDLFTDETRSIVYGIFYIAIPFGTGLGFGVGNAPSEWRNGLRITPGLTFLAAFLILIFLYDPPRGESDGKASTNKSSYSDDLKYIASKAEKRNIISLISSIQRCEVFCLKCRWIHLRHLHNRRPCLVCSKLHQ